VEGRIKVKIAIWVVSIVIIVGGGFGGYNYYMNYKSGKLEAKKNQQEIEGIVDGINGEEDNKGEGEGEDGNRTELKSSDYYPEQDVYDIMHRMSNTKIISENNKIWGELPIDDKSIESLKSLVSEIDYEDRDYLLEVLARWEGGDFSQADKEHNYFWTKLGGTVGEAIGIK